MNFRSYKNHIFFLFLFFCFGHANGQVEEYLTSVPKIGRLVIHQNNLYFSYWSQEGSIIAGLDLNDEVESYSTLTELEYRRSSDTMSNQASTIFQKG